MWTTRAEISWKTTDGRLPGRYRSGAFAGFPAGDGLDGETAVMRHQLDDPVHVACLEPADHPLMVPLRLLGVDQAGEGIGRGGIPEIGEEAKQPVAAGPAEGDEMKLPIKMQVFAPLHRVGRLAHLAAQPAHFLDIVTGELGDGHHECLPLEYLAPVVNVGQVFGRQGADEEADPRLVLEVPGRSERGQRLAHGNMGYPQVGRDRTGRKLRTRLQLARNNRLFDLLLDVGQQGLRLSLTTLLRERHGCLHLPYGHEYIIASWPGGFDYH